MVNEKPKPITEIPVTAEARETWLRELFEGDLPHPGELFVPTDSFYANGLSRARAKSMLRELCAWLGIKPGYVGLVFESNATDHPDGRRYTIFIDQDVLHDEFVLGGFLAYCLTRYLLEEKKGIRLPDMNQQAALLASASIVFGLGVVVMNGLSPTYGWVQTWRHRKSFLLKGFPMPNYTQMLRNFLHSHQILSRRYAAALTPWAAQRLRVRPTKRPFHAIALARHQVKLTNLKTIGITWLLLFIVGLGTFVSLQRTTSTNPKVHAAEEKIEQLHQLKKLCDDSLVYDRQYADLSDIQTERAINADAARCKSLQNQLDSAEQQYNQLKQ